MTNSMYVLVNYYAKELKAPREVQHQRFVDTNQPYWLLQLSTSIEGKKITLAGREFTILEHHITIPEKPEGDRKALYHYTMLLEETGEDPKKRVLHLYFDDQDVMTIEPDLKPQTTTKKSKKSDNMPLAETDINDAVNLAMPYITRTLFELRDKKKEAIAKAKMSLAKNEIAMTIKSIDPENMGAPYLAFIENQLTIIKNAQEIGITEFDKEAKIYLNLKKANGDRPAKAPSKEKEQKTEKTQDKQTSESETKPSETLMVNTVAVRHETEDSKREACPLEELLKKCNEVVAAYSVAVKDASLINTMLELYEQGLLLSNWDGAEKLKHQLLHKRIQMKRFIVTFFSQSENLLEHQSLYIAACKINLVSVNEKTIKEIIAKLDPDFLIRLIKEKLLVETERYALSSTMPELRYTLLEWAVYFEQHSFMNTLLKSGFSFHYLMGENSPLNRVAMSHKKYFQLYNALHDPKDKKQFEKLIEKIAKRYADWLIEHKKDPDYKSMQLKLELMQTNIAITRVLNQKPFLRRVLSNVNDKPLFVDKFDRMISFEEILNRDVVSLNILLQHMKSILTLLGLLTVQLKGLVNGIDTADLGNVPDCLIDVFVELRNEFVILQTQKNRVLIELLKSGIPLKVNSESKIEPGPMSRNRLQEAGRYLMQIANIDKEIQNKLNDPRVLSAVCTATTTNLLSRTIMDNPGFSGFANAMPTIIEKLHALTLERSGGSKHTSSNEPSDFIPDVADESVIAMLPYYAYLNGVALDKSIEYSKAKTPEDEQTQDCLNHLLKLNI